MARSKIPPKDMESSPSKEDDESHQSNASESLVESPESGQVATLDGKSQTSIKLDKDVALQIMQKLISSVPEGKKLVKSIMTSEDITSVKQVNSPSNIVSEINVKTKSSASATSSKKRKSHASLSHDIMEDDDDDDDSVSSELTEVTTSSKATKLSFSEHTKASLRNVAHDENAFQKKVAAAIEKQMSIRNKAKEMASKMVKKERKKLNF